MSASDTRLTGAAARARCALIVAFAAGCPRSEAPDPPRPKDPAATQWLGPGVRVFGSSEASEPQAALGHLLGPGAVYGVGRLAGGEGVLTFDDGLLWTTVVDATGALKTRRVQGGERYSGSASVLAFAQVDAWNEFDVATTLDLGAVAGLVRRMAPRPRRSMPVLFRIVGRAKMLILRVPRPGSAPPVYVEHRDVAVHVIGVAGEVEPGTLLDAGRDVHAHAILESGQVTGYVTSLEISPGADLFLPAGDPLGF